VKAVIDTNGFTESSVVRGSCAFGNGLDLSEVPDLTEIGASTFQYCTGIKGSITLPNSLTAIVNGAFQNCTGITGIANNQGRLGTGLYVVELGGVKAVIDTNGFSGSSRVQGGCAFGNGLDLSEVPNLESIGNSAFSGCTNITGSLVLPSTLKNIGANVFINCTGIAGTLNLPTNLEFIGSNAFLRCTGFTGSLTLPSTLAEVSHYAFEYCAGINNVVGSYTNEPSWSGTGIFSN
jgi:hypothetical protein